MTGATISQIIPLIFLPVITRFYQPFEYAALVIFITSTTILALFATGRYELAIVLPKVRKHAFSIVFLATGLLILMDIIYYLIITFLGAKIGQFPFAINLIKVIYLLPISVFFFGFYQILSNIANREKQYRKIAISGVLQQTTIVIFSIVLGALHKSNGLIIAQVIGQTISCCVLLSLICNQSLFNYLKHISWKNIWLNAQLYKQFPLFNLPYSAIGTFSQDFIIIALTYFNQAYAAGLYSLGRKVIFAPVTFLSVSVGQVYYKEAATNFGKPVLEKLTTNVSLLIVSIFLPIFIIFMFFAPKLFALIFGEQWCVAGDYAVLIAPVAYLFLFTSWPERIYEVARKQHWSLLIQAVMDVVSISVIVSMLLSGVSAYYCIGAFSVIACSYHLTYLITAYKIARFTNKSLFLIFKDTIKIGFIFILFGILTRYLSISLVLELILASVLLISYYFRWFLKKEYNLLLNFG